MSQTIRTVGSGGNYTTLKAAFDAINAGTITGTIVLQIISNTTETASAALNASGTGSANYTSVTIYPTGAGGYTITGNLTAPIINFNGADNVTIDGRVNQTGSSKSLTISNTNTGGPVIQFIADATSNIVRYCIVRGVTTSVTSGVIFFSTGTSTGNDNNTITNCDIRDGATTPSNLIFSLGSSTAVDNSNITISDCNIFNFFSAATASNGVFASTNNSAWTIDNNRFYQESTRTSTAAVTHRAIQINSASGGNFLVTNNVIGYANAAGTGNMVYTGSVALLFRAIEITSGTSIASSIQGNTISGISLTTTSNSTTAPGIFSGISVLAGRVNIGNISGNVIGAGTGNGAINVTTTTSTPLFTGIYATTTATVNIQNNTIGSISTGGGATIGYTFHAISTAGTGGNITIASNLIGSLTTSNSISIGINGTTTTGVCTFNGIRNAATGVIDINSNDIHNFSAFGTAASVSTGIINTAGSGTLNISYNNIVSGTNTGTGAFTGISNSAAASTLIVNNNVLRNHVRTATTGTFTGIANSGAVTDFITINYNQLGNASGGLLTYIAANSSALLGISNSGGAATCVLSIQYNDIRGINHIVAGSNTHTYYTNSAATLRQDINHNTLTALNVNTTGAITFISNNVAMPANGIQNINNNSIVSSFTRNAASTAGSITLFTSTTATNNANVTVTQQNNNFSNITVYGAATISGWVNTDAGTGNVTKTISGNVFSNWNGGTGVITAMSISITSPNNATSGNIISNISSEGSITGISTAAGNDQIYSNTIHSLISIGQTAIVTGINITGGTTKHLYSNEIYNLVANNITSGSIRAIAVATATTTNIHSNKIYGLSSSSASISTGILSGILIASGTTHNIYNNRIANITASASGIENSVRGINITSTTANSNINLYYNSIYLNASSTGANFGSSGVFHTYSNTSTTARLTMINNIITNLSQANGTGVTAAFQRSASTNLNNYNTTSNNNLFFAGSPSSNRVIFREGTVNRITLSDFKTRVSPRETNSISENPPFISVVGTSPDFLKISTTSATEVESGGINIPTYTTDFEGDIRAGNSGFPPQQNGFGYAPDIGADEFDGRKIAVIVTNAHASSNGNYGTLATAFSAINAQSQTGFNILIRIVASTIEPTSAILNAGTWTSITIYPTASGLTITGNLDANPLIDFNGADNVTLDGRVNGLGSTPSLIVSNTSISALAGTSTIRFINSSENNTVRYCNIRGSTLSTSDGIISFSPSSVGNGNDVNLIEYCNISNAGGNRPINAIFSAGSSTRENNLNVIRYNNLFNFLNPAASSNGIHFGSHTTSCLIWENNFYETTNFIPQSGSFSFAVIRIVNAAGNDIHIINNYIGGSAGLCGGAAWTVDASTNHHFRAITLDVGSGVASTVQNNVITNWDYRSGSSSPWRAIEVIAGNVDIGTINGNTIGSTTGTGSIIITATVNAESQGVYIASSGTVNIANNRIGSITIIGNDTNVSHSFTGIYKLLDAAGTINITNNIIGSTNTINSIFAVSQAVTSTAAQHLSAILTESIGTINVSGNTIANLVNSYAGTGNSRTRGIRCTKGNCLIENNTIYNLSSASLTPNFWSVIGITLNGTENVNNITNNVIYNLGSTAPTFSGYIAGIYVTGNLEENIVSRNFIHSLSVHPSSTAASIYGIQIASGATTYSNNIIALAGNTTTTIYGIFETGATSNNNSLYHNTVYIGGNLSPGNTSTSYALYSNAATNTRDFRNNIFANYRSTTGGSNLHYAAYFNYGVSTGLTLNYNNYYTPGSGGVLGFYNGTNRTTLPIVPGQDAQSLSVNPQFVNPGGLNAIDYKINTALYGAIGIGIPIDYSLNSRGTPPDMGAWEYLVNMWRGTINTDFGNPSNWTNNAVPVPSANVIFSSNPNNHCLLDQNRIIGSIINEQSVYKLDLNGKQLTLKGSLNLTNGAQVVAGGTSSTIVFEGTTSQAIPAGAFEGNEVFNLTVNNANNVLINGTLKIKGVISSLQGALDATTNNPTLSFSGSTTQTISPGVIHNNQAHILVIENSEGVVLNTNFTVNNSLNIQSGGKLLVAPTRELTSIGTINNNAGESGLVIRSDISGTGSLLHNTNNVPATFQRYWRGVAEAWHLLSSPMQAQTISGDFIPSGTYGDGTGYDFYHWHEPDTSWIYFNHPATWAATHGSNVFVPGRGYIVSYQATNPTKMFSGLLNNGNVSINITKSNNTAENFGFNLVGNPYPSSIDWKSSSGWSRDILDDSGGGYDMWIWNDVEKNYGVYNSGSSADEGTLGVTRYIAPTQGFFVKAETSGNLGFSNQVRVHTGASNWLKSGYESTHTLSLMVTAPDSKGSDEVRIEFGHPNEKGSLKKFSYVASAPSLFIPNKGKFYSMHLFNDISKYHVLPLCFKAGVDGLYSLKSIPIHGLFDVLELVDLKTGARQNLNLNNEYIFQASPADNPARFVLQFVRGNYPNPHSEPPISIATNDHYVYFDLQLVTGVYMAELFDITGRLIWQGSLAGGARHEVNVGLKGVFVVRLSGADGKIRKKIIL